MKNVLLLGDSIRLSYQPKVKELLKDKANVFGPEENGRWSGYTLNSLRFWLPFFPNPDIVHVNNGIWDTGDDYALGRPFTLPDDYVSTLERIAIVLRKLCGETVRVIFATPTPPTEKNKRATDEYNALLRQAAERQNVEVNDLHKAIAADITGNIGPDHIHLSEKGVELAAFLVAGCIGKYL